MNGLARASKYVVLVGLVLLILPRLLVTRVEPGQVGVRQSAVSGVNRDDMSPGWHWRIPGLHKLIYLPSGYFFLDYTNDDNSPEAPLQIRTKDNNNVLLDVSVPIRIKAGTAHSIVQAGNHVRDAGGRYRYMRLAQETTVSVLREQLADLDSVGFYSTQRRLEVTGRALELLNAALDPLHLEAQAVLIRAVQFRDEYEKQLGQIQLNEQNKLLDQARQKVANAQQGLDNYVQGTAAQVSARTQDWIKRQAELGRAYQLGSLDVVDGAPGAARAKLAAMAAEEAAGLRAQAARVFGLDNPESVSDAYLLGINNLAAETLEYKQRVSAEADAISGRLTAEGEAMMAQVRGEYERQLNALLSSPAGRAYVAWKSADKVTFAKTLTFNSREGIPSILRLRAFAEQFMGTR
ncbi:MAG: SPFH domain-containing protein [Kofleriaceae bacterium]|nr:SPFH domain-containing protein [Kofleriaceae bacterium]